MKQEESKITVQAVAHTAALAQLRLTPQETAAMQQELSRVLSYMEILSEAPILDAARAPDSEQITREDRVTSSLPREALLSLTPHQNGETFTVPLAVDC